ncbi:transposase [Sorangium sp. So ce693]|uniref:transposase n=1 Tax=Sorangium sp. So ce693 TaxID=3133318 RepID=UPI003F5E79D6
MLDSVWSPFKLNDPDSFENRTTDFVKRWTGIFDKTLVPYHRAEVRGLDRIPRQDGLIYVGNHNGYPYMTELWLFLAGLFNEYGMSRYPYILTHQFSLKLPFVNQLFTGIGGVRATAKNAIRVLERGSPLLVYPGADAELMRPYRERTRLRFNGRTSHIRLALKRNVPIVPVAGVGGHSTAIILDDLPWLAEAIGAKSRLGVHAWPLILSIPWGLTLGPAIPPYVPWPSKIILEALEPMAWKRSAAGAESESRVAECAAQVEQAIESAMARLEAERLARERPPLDVAKDAALRSLRWVEEQIKLFVRWLAAVMEGSPGLSGRREEQREASSAAARVRSDLAHDIDLLRGMLERTGRRAAGAVAAAGSPPPGTARPSMPPAGEPEGPPATASRAASAPARSRYTESEIRAVLEQVKHGKTVAEVCREHGIAAGTFYRWRSRYLPASAAAGLPARSDPDRKGMRPARQGVAPAAPAG